MKYRSVCARGPRRRKATAAVFARGNGVWPLYKDKFPICVSKKVVNKDCFGIDSVVES